MKSHQLSGHTVLSSWIRSICQTVRGYGIDPLPLMKIAGMQEQLLHIPNARFDYQSVRAFWQLIINETGDHLIGLRVGQEIQVSTLNSLGLALITSENLNSMIMLLIKYSKLISTTMHFHLEHADKNTVLVCRTLDGSDGSEPNSSARLAMLSFIYRQACSLAQHEIKPKEVALSLKYDSNSSRLDEYFNVPVTLGAEYDSIMFSYDDLIEPYAGGNAHLVHLNEQIIQSYLTDLKKADLLSQVTQQIHDTLEQGEPKLTDIAKQLNLTSRTLQRRLKDENYTFQQLLDEKRKDLAHELLAHSDFSIAEISYKLGFSDPSNLCRACHRWFGCSPNSHRRNSLRVIA